MIVVTVFYLIMSEFYFQLVYLSPFLTIGIVETFYDALYD